MAILDTGGTGFMVLVLEELGAPASEGNTTGMRLWATSEGMPTGENNPLATTLPWPGSVAVNQDGVRRYPTVTAGVAATVATLRDARYLTIRDTLQLDAGLKALWQAINVSSWCRGCSNGLYPERLWEVAFGKHAPTPPAASRQQPPPTWDWSAHIGEHSKALSGAAGKLEGVAVAMRHLRTGSV